jgi:hypothetical protein
MHDLSAAVNFPALPRSLSYSLSSRLACGICSNVRSHVQLGTHQRFLSLLLLLLLLLRAG